jgi:hypothetical protein
MDGLNVRINHRDYRKHSNGRNTKFDISMSSVYHDSNLSVAQRASYGCRQYNRSLCHVWQGGVQR